MKFVKVVFFDAAGTLFHVRGSVGQIYAEVAREFGVRADPSALHKSFLRAFREHSERGFPDERRRDLRAAERAWWASVVREAFGASMPEQTLPAYFDRVYELFRSACAWELYPDSRPALEELRTRGFRLAVISNFDSRLQDVLANLGVASCFEKVFISWRVGAAKPAAAIFRYALRIMGIRAHEAAHVGDSPEEDVAGALGAGLRAVLLDRTGALEVPPGGSRVLGLCELCALLI